MWLSYRCFVARGKETIPLFGACRLASQIGLSEYARPRRFREKLDGWLESVCVLWPDCLAEISADGERLIVNQAIAVRPEQRLLNRWNDNPIYLGRTTRHPGYEISLSKRWLVEKPFGWLKQIGPLKKVKLRSLAKVNWLFVFSCAAFNLYRIPKLREQCA